MSDHLPLHSTETEHEAEAAVRKFHNCFGETRYFFPYGFYNSDRLYEMSRMHQSPRVDASRCRGNDFALYGPHPHTVTYLTDIMRHMHTPSGHIGRGRSTTIPLWINFVVSG